MRKAALLIVISAMLWHGPGKAADKERRVFTPSGQWAMEYAEDACRLIRNFTDGENEITLAFERFELGPATRLGVAGNGLKPWSSASTARFRYSSAGETRASPLLRGELADGRTSFLIADASLISPERWRALLEKTYADSLGELDRADEAAAAQVTAIVIGEGFKDEIEVRLGQMVEPVKALQACVMDLVKSWGLDPQTLMTMVKPPQPVKPPNLWLNSADYPADMLRTRQMGDVVLRLIVNTQGEVEACHFEVTPPGAFELAACQGIRKRVRFKPALDSKGQALRTYWRQHVRFLIPGG